jgi:hypothetical protein
LAGREGWLAVLLDLDDDLARPRLENDGLYSEAGLARVSQALRPGGVLALWSPERSPTVTAGLHARLQNVAEIAVPVELPDHALDYVYRARRPAEAPDGTRPTN